MAAAFAALMALALALLAAPAAAHHILGIPHYKYSEAYPQIPFVEVKAQTPHAELDFTYMPGTPRPGERVRFKLYVKRLKDGEPLRMPMKVEVLRDTFFEGVTNVGSPFEIRVGKGPEKNDYKFFVTFEEPEAYKIRVHFPDVDRVEVIDFPVTIGATDDRPLIYGAFGLLVVVAGVVAVTKRRRRASNKRATKGRSR